MSQAMLSGLLMVAAVVVVPANGADSYRIDPTETSVLGLPLATLDSDWALASLVNEQNLPSIAKEDLARVTDPSVRFVLDGDFNSDGRPDKAVVGVYRTRGGKEGQFLLIVTQGASGAWAVSYLGDHAGFPGPSLLYQAPKWLNWFPCTACDLGATVSWKHGHYQAKWANTDAQTR